jgi:hypothetical protein
MKKKCCSPDKPHKLEWPDFSVELKPGRHWFSYNKVEVLSESFDEDVIVTNWGVNFEWKVVTAA